MQQGAAEARVDDRTVRCYKCRTSVLLMGNCARHGEGEGQCSVLFVKEPLPQWLDERREEEGPALCPKCRAKLGETAWKPVKCACGQWGTGVRIIKSKVDISF